MNVNRVLVFVNEIDFDYRALGEDFFHYCYNLWNTIAIILEQRVFFPLCCCSSILYQWHCIHTLSQQSSAIVFNERLHILVNIWTKFIEKTKRWVFEIVHAGSAICLWNDFIFNEDAIKIDLSQNCSWTRWHTQIQLALKLNGKETMNEFEWITMNGFIHKAIALWLLLTNAGINEER